MNNDEVRAFLFGCGMSVIVSALVGGMLKLPARSFMMLLGPIAVAFLAVIVYIFTDGE